MSFLKRLKNKVFGIQKKDEVLETIKESRQVDIEKKYEKGLSKAKEGFFKRLKLFFVKNRPIDEEFFKEFEELLVMADVGYEYAITLSNRIKNEVKLRGLTETNQLTDLIVEVMYEIYTDGDDNIAELNIKRGRMNVILVTGVNGSGKTTSIGKLTKKLNDANYKVALVAADTFRAGAVAQLQVWAERMNVKITIPDKEGQDPASVAFKALQEAKVDGTEVVIVDTAGRLQNKQNLMLELSKIKKIIEREIGRKPDETLLVIDATTGQNGALQAKGFNEATELTGIILSKMDSSSKGGIILAIKQIFDIPVKFIGLGETLDDLEVFDINKYLYGLTTDLADEINE